MSNQSGHESHSDDRNKADAAVTDAVAAAGGPVPLVADYDAAADAGDGCDVAERVIRVVTVQRIGGQGDVKQQAGDYCRSPSAGDYNCGCCCCCYYCY